MLWELVRPFTLLAPSVGVLSGAMIGSGGWPPLEVLWGILSAALLNAASNVVNQMFDLEIDRLNKPDRVLPSGRLPVHEAKGAAAILFLLSFVAAWLVPNKQFFVIVCLAAAITFFYSSPPLRMKRFPFLSNLWIAIPRGLLLMVSGWASVRDIWEKDIWFIGGVLGLFVFGATTTKDFSDVEGDRRYGCRTLPLLLGNRRAALFMAPFLILPFLALPLGKSLGFLKAPTMALWLLGISLSLWGCYVTWLILRKPEALAVDRNHVSWKHMYLMMMAAQAGLAWAYWGLGY